MGIIGTKVLILEKDAQVVTDLTAILEKAGFTVSGLASSHRAAIELAQRELPSIALIAPSIEGDRDGFATARLFSEFFQVPFIYLVTHEEFDQLRNSGIPKPEGYIIKPLEKDDILSSMEIALNNQGTKQRLLSNLDMFNSALYAMDSNLLIADPEGKVNFINARVEELCGTLSAQVQGKPVNEFLFNGSPNIWNKIAFADGEEESSFKVFEDNIFLNSRTKGRIPVSLSVTRFFSRMGEASGYLIRLEEKEETLNGSLSVSSQEGLNNYFFIRDKSTLFKIQMSDILWIEALGNYVKVYTTDHHYTALATLKEIQNMLPQSNFFQVHRSYIIALDKILSIQMNEVIIGNGRIPIGKTYKDRLMERLPII